MNPPTKSEISQKRQNFKRKTKKEVLRKIQSMEELNHKFPLSEPQIVGEQNQKDFIALFGAILRMRNLLLSFDEFKGNELISERNLDRKSTRLNSSH